MIRRQCRVTDGGADDGANSPSNRTNRYPNYNDGLSTMQQRRHIPRRKQRRYTVTQRIHYFILNVDGMGRIALIICAFLLSFWISHKITLRMVTRLYPSFTVTPRTRFSPYHRILNRSKTTNEISTPAFSIVFTPQPLHRSSRHFVLPGTFPPLKRRRRPDFGGIDLRVVDDKRLRLQERAIYHDYIADVGYTEILEEQDDDEVVESYYSFDDDTKRNPYVEYDDPDIHLRKQCRRTSWHRDVPVMCNPLHEFDFRNNLANGKTKFVGSGAYRHVYLTSGSTDSNDGSFVLKILSLNSEFSYDDYEFVRMDANVNEKLNYSPRIVSMYSFCGISITSEAMMQGDIEHYSVPTGVGRPLSMPNEELQLPVRNELSGIQKLVWSLDMAEAILLLHTFPGGVIVHDDIQPSQFLLSSTGQMKLNDFNRAEIMLWNEKDGEYCKYRNHPGSGDWRSPEEYLDRPLDEKIDIWSLGNNMYTLLTGLYPFYDSMEHDVPKKVVDGLTAYIDPRHKERSFAEAKLAEIIPQCWIYDAYQRIDITQLVNLLRMAVQENEAMEVIRRETLIKLLPKVLLNDGYREYHRK